MKPLDETDEKERECGEYTAGVSGGGGQGLGGRKGEWWNQWKRSPLQVHGRSIPSRRPTEGLIAWVFPSQLHTQFTL
jgi:hypothetical protein